MIAVTGRLANGRSILPTDFADITLVPVVSVAFNDAGRLVVTFESDIDLPTARRVRRRIVTSDTAEEQRREAIAAAAAVIDDMQPIINPTVVKVLDRLEILRGQVRRLAVLVLANETDEPVAPPPPPVEPPPTP